MKLRGVSSHIAPIIISKTNKPFQLFILKLLPRGGYLFIESENFEDPSKVTNHSENKLLGDWIGLTN